MSKKVLAIVALAAVIAVSSGVIAFTGGSKKPNQANTDATTTSAVDNGSGNPADPDDPSEEEIIDLPELDPSDFEDETYSVEESQAPELPTSYPESVEPSVPYEEQIISATMSIKYVVDHSTGAETSPRVAFGKDYNYCYAAFNSDKSFEMCVDPSSGAILHGTYAIYGNVVSVEYDNGLGAEYDIISNEDGEITHVIVSHGDYDIYFGVD